MNLISTHAKVVNKCPSLGFFLVQLRKPFIKGFIGLVTALMVAYAWLYYPIAQGHGGDFIAMLSGRQLDAGYWNGYGVGYGPVFALYDLVFRGVTDQITMRVMYVLNLGMLFLALLLVVKRFLPAPRTLEETLASVFLWVCFYPTFQALRQNNVEITELLFLVLMLEALRRRNDGLAGVCLGIAGATKILPFVLVVYFLWRRRFRLSAVSILTGIGLFAFVIALKGEAFNIVLAELWAYSVQPWATEFQNNQAISGFVWRAFSHFDFSTRWSIEYPIVFNTAAARNVTIGVCLVLFVLVVAIMMKSTGLWPRPTDDQRLETVEIAIVLIGMLLLLPHNHTHYFILVAWIYLAALREWPQPAGAKGRWVFALLALSYMLLGLLHLWRLFDPFLYRFGPVTGVDLARLASLPFFGALAGLAALLVLHGHLAQQSIFRLTLPHRTTS